MNPNSGKPMYGLGKYWECKKCKGLWNRGNGVITKKTKITDLNWFFKKIKEKVWGGIK